MNASAPRRKIRGCIAASEDIGLRGSPHSNANQDGHDVNDE